MYYKIKAKMHKMFNFIDIVIIIVTPLVLFLYASAFSHYLAYYKVTASAADFINTFSTANMYILPFFILFIISQNKSCAYLEKPQYIARGKSKKKIYFMQIKMILIKSLIYSFWFFICGIILSVAMSNELINWSSVDSAFFLLNKRLIDESIIHIIVLFFLWAIVSTILLSVINRLFIIIFNKNIISLIFLLGIYFIDIIGGKIDFYIFNRFSLCYNNWIYGYFIEVRLIISAIIISLLVYLGLYIYKQKDYI